VPSAALAAGPAPVTPAIPAAATAVGGYVWSDSGVPDGYYAYNSVDHSAGAVTISKVSPGLYDVDFAHLSSIAGSAMVQVTAFSSADNCTAGSWGPAGSNLEITVACFGSTTGLPNDADFNLIATRPTHTPHGTFDYAWVNKLTASGTLTSSYQYNSAHKKNSVRHLGTGKYQVTFGGPRSAGTHGIVKVTAYGVAPGDCQLAGWKGSAKGEVVDVDCFTSGHAGQNREFDVTYAASNSLLGINGQVDANALANGRGAVYQPAVQYDSKRGARVTVAHYATGSYEVLAAGSAGNTGLWGGDVQVNSIGSDGKHCVVAGWSQQYTPAIDVSCFDRHGHQVNAPFAIEWIVP
jgi:hypothetical protein